MFDMFKQGKEDNTEEKMLDKQLSAQEKQTVMANATDPNADVTFLEQQERRADLIRWQQEMDEETLSLVMSFLSMRKDEDGKPKAILDEKGKPLPPLCNTLFIHQVVKPKLKPFASKNLINSNYDANRILGKLKYTMDDITDMMADNWDRYGIDFVNFNGILRDMANFMEDSCWRSLKGWTKKIDGTMIKRLEQENFGEIDVKKKKGMFGLFSG